MAISPEFESLANRCGGQDDDPQERFDDLDGHRLDDPDDRMPMSMEDEAAIYEEEVNNPWATCMDCFGNGCKNCDNSGQLLKPGRLVWVALYEQSRVYGGPEEGGWYYTQSSLVTDARVYAEVGFFPRAFADYKEAKAYREEWSKHYDERFKGSHKLERFKVEDYVAQTLPTLHPIERPHYC
jgi:hypothetical protein